MLNKIFIALLTLFLIVFVSFSIYIFYLKNTIKDLQVENMEIQIQKQLKDETIKEINRRNNIVLYNQKKKQELKEQSKIKDDNKKDIENKLECLFK